VDPSIHVGGGYTFFGDSSYGTLNPGAGLAFWFTDNVGFLLQLQKLLEIEKMLMAFLSHFQHTAGLTFKFGGKILTVMEYMIKMMLVQTLLV
jgi:hypothetical protein